MKIHVVKSERHQRRKRVAAYCRVSTMDCSQEESYETQKEYYENYIRYHDEWDFAGIYADQGITGTSAEKRPQFLACINDAVSGKIDLILVKSISRFSRNIVDCQSYVAKLKSYGVEVYFEKESLSTMDPTSGMIFSLMGLIAQSESESISQNIRWAVQQRYKKGEYHIGNNQVLGYDDDNGVPKPNKDAWIIRMVFKRFLEGMSYSKIAEEVNSHGGHSLRGAPLSKKDVEYILHNELYVGDKHLQKNPPKNYLTHRPDPSIEAQDYYLQDVHTPIIDRDTWNRTQELLSQRTEMAKAGVTWKPGSSHFLRGKVFCGECGAPFMRKNTGRGKWVKKAWCCKERFKGKNGNGCRNRIILEDMLIQMIEEQTGQPVDDSFNGRVVVYQDRIEVSLSPDDKIPVAYKSE